MSDTNQTATHQHSIPEEGVEPMGVNAIAMAFWGVISTAIVIATMLVAVATTHEMENYLNQKKVINVTNAAARNAIALQQDVLNSKPIAEGDSYRIPISLAKKLIVNELQSQ